MFDYFHFFLLTDYIFGVNLNVDSWNYLIFKNTLSISRNFNFNIFLSKSDCPSFQKVPDVFQKDLWSQHCFWIL